MKLWPVIAYLCLAGFGTLIHIARDGTPRRDRYDAATALLADVIVGFLLWQGNFFAPLGWPAP